MNKEVFNLKDVFVPAHKVARVPKSAYKTEMIFYAMFVITTVISRFYVYIFSSTNKAVANGTAILGVILFLIYQLKDVVSTVMSSISNHFSQKNSEMLEIDLAKQSVNITSKVTGKVLFDNKNLSNSAIMANVRQYISKYRKTREFFIRMCISLAIFIANIFFSIDLAVDDFGNVLLFVGTMISAIIVTTISSYKRIVNSHEYFSKESEFSRKSECERNDCLNMKAISKTHSDFMLDNYLTTLRAREKYRLKNGIKNNVVEIKNSAVISIAMGIVVIESIIAVGINNLNADSFLAIASLATVFASTLYSINSQIATVHVFLGMKSECSQEKRLFTEIMRIYDGEVEEEEVNGDISLEPFEFSYAGTNFSLKSKRRLCFRRGEMILVKGESGTGKSTLLKILSGKIKLSNNKRISSVYSPCGGELGCQSLLEEITWGDLQYEKLIEILKGSAIYDELVEKAEGKELLEYMSCAGTTDFSDGQKQRLRLARALYHLDKCSLVILDEIIANVDKKNAHKMLAFVREYAARKMNKIVVVTTHQFYGEEKQFDQILDVKKEGCEGIII